jgi:hypothetical protein
MLDIRWLMAWVFSAGPILCYPQSSAGIVINDDDGMTTTGIVLDDGDGTKRGDGTKPKRDTRLERLLYVMLHLNSSTSDASPFSNMLHGRHGAPEISTPVQQVLRKMVARTGTRKVLRPCNAKSSDSASHVTRSGWTVKEIFLVLCAYARLKSRFPDVAVSSASFVRQLHEYLAEEHGDCWSRSVTSLARILRPGERPFEKYGEKDLSVRSLVDLITPVNNVAPSPCSPPALGRGGGQLNETPERESSGQNPRDCNPDDVHNLASTHDQSSTHPIRYACMQVSLYSCTNHTRHVCVCVYDVQRLATDLWQARALGL